MPTTIEQYFARLTPGRRIEGVAAVLLPFDSRDNIAEDAFCSHLTATRDAGLTCAVNMDTGYVNLLSAEEKTRVLGLTRDALGRESRFMAGAYIDREEGDTVALYRREIAQIRDFGGTPVLFQTARLHGAPSSRIVETYRTACRGAGEVIAFELGRMFAPNGVIFDVDTVAGIMQIPEITGMKHSSLDRQIEMHRLDLRDRVRPEFRIYTGNDLGIDMAAYGSDYLLGLATFWPEAFAARDRAWADGDPAWFALNDALQHLGNIAFRAPVPAYKHSAAIFLHMRHRIPTSRTHRENLTRPPWEPEILADCAARIEAAMNPNSDLQPTPGAASV